MSAQNAAGIRRRNVSALLRLVHQMAPVSRRELAAESGLSPATVASIAHELVVSGALVETSRAQSGAGRPVGELALNARRGSVIGVDMAETYVCVDVFDGAMTRVHTAGIPLSDRDRTPVEAADAVAATVTAAMTGAGISADAVLGLGITVPGQVEPATGLSVFAPNWNWHDVDFGRLVRERLNLPVYLDNPLKAVLMGQLWAAVLPPHGDVVVVDLGTGVGAGVAVDGQIYRGVTNAAGEWGHTSLVPDGRACRCGAIGCVEAYIGGPGILATLREVAPDSRWLAEDQTSAVTSLARAQREGDGVATQVAEITGRYLGFALANLVNMLNPEVVAIAGWVSDAWGECLLALAMPWIRQQALAQSLAAASLGLCAVESNPASFGIAAITLEEAATRGLRPAHLRVG
jgi:predicted NBD/HSP70 family sugar kinase